MAQRNAAWIIQRGLRPWLSALRRPWSTVSQRWIIFYSRKGPMHRGKRFTKADSVRCSYTLFIFVAALIGRLTHLMSWNAYEIRPPVIVTRRIRGTSIFANAQRFANRWSNRYHRNDLIADSILISCILRCVRSAFNNRTIIGWILFYEMNDA